MNTKLNKLLILILIIGFVESNGETCSVLKNNDKLCGYSCYEAVKPLLQYVATLKAKEQLYDETILKVAELENTIKHMLNTIKDKEKQLEMQLEMSQAYKVQSLYAGELLKLKNAEILELQSRLYEKFDAVPYNPITAVKNVVPHKVKNSLVIQSSGYTDQSIMAMYTVKTPAVEEPMEIRNLQENPNNTVKYLAMNCIGKSTDVYAFFTPGIKHFMIPCDSTLAGSGWTVIQRREDGTENFNRNWYDYQRGFGDLRKEFFIGLEKLYLITNSQPYELYIHLEDFNNEIRFARYSHFVVGNEMESYAIKFLGEYSGNAENALQNHINIQFSTPDRNMPEELTCAKDFKSGWWFSEGCYVCNLNGPYVTGNMENSYGIEWRSWHLRPLKFVQMMIRPTNIE